ncbi:hypothetical protein [Sulfuricurvum sp.]|uniref:hypothetical protein n=1 Tax=Sulfuricurvum sp. TaxID=2025608 RepID=UPI003566D11D
MDTPLNHLENLNITKTIIEDCLMHLRNKTYNQLNMALINLLEEILREVERFITGRSDLTLTSLQVRNIFELYLITKHVSTNQEGLNDWYGQMHKDSIDLQNGFMNLFSSHNQDISELHDIQDFINESLANSPFESKREFNIKNLAIDYDYLLDYQAIHKLCSKLIHPSSIKINSFKALLEDDNYLNLLIIFGVFFCQKIEVLCQTIKSEKSN